MNKLNLTASLESLMTIQKEIESAIDEVTLGTGAILPAWKQAAVAQMYNALKTIRESAYSLSDNANAIVK